MLDGNLNIVRSIVIPLRGGGDTYTFIMPGHHVAVTAVFGVATGIHNIQDDNVLKAFARDGVLHVSGLTAGQSWNVYTLTGSLVNRGIATSDKAAITLPGHGVYIVTDGKGVVKVVN
jgi:hypothetical protein